MTYFDFELDPKEEAAAILIGDAGDELQSALLRVKDRDGLTQQKLADRLGIDRATVNRCFSGHRNLTLRTIAEIAWALDHDVQLKLIDKNEEAVGCNFFRNEHRLGSIANDLRQSSVHTIEITYQAAESAE